MPINISFGGAQIQRPGAYSVVDSANMVALSAGGFHTLAAIGTPGVGSTLPAGKVSYFNDPVLAAEQITDSELLDIMKVAWKHGADLIGVSPVAATALDADWQAAIDLLTAEDIDGIMIASTTAAIQAKVDAHCTLMSSVANRRERRAFYGHATALAVEAITALQAALNNEFGLMATPGVYDYDANGTKVLKGSHYLAAAYAGVWAGQAVQEPITYKYVKFPGLEKVYTGTEINTLLQGHIAPTEYVRNRGYRIVQGITLSADDDLTKSELSVSSEKVAMSQTLRDYFEAKYIGKAGVAGIEVTMYNDLVCQLENFKTQGWISDYVKDTTSVVKSGTSFILQWEGVPTLPINNFLITNHLHL
jgi:hypothetical protein